MNQDYEWSRFLLELTSLIGAPPPAVTELGPNGPNGWRVYLLNGTVLSVQRHPFAISDDQTAETAAWYDGDSDNPNAKSGEWVWPEQIRGRQTPAEVIHAVRELSALDPIVS